VTMSSFIDQFRKGVDTAAFEARRQARILALQNDIASLRARVREQQTSLGEATYRLFQAGQVEQPELVQLCQALRDLENQIADKQAEIERVKQEQPPVRAAGPGGAQVCTNCRAPLSPDDAFCPQCGTKVDIPASPQGAAMPGPRTCPACGAVVAEGAVYCGGCGTRVS
jgi:RNA polymerase subunit RPABC4/transcription elongation factor Spt4